MNSPAKANGCVCETSTGPDDDDGKPCASGMDSTFSSFSSGSFSSLFLGRFCGVKASAAGSASSPSGVMTSSSNASTGSCRVPSQGASGWPLVGVVGVAVAVGVAGTVLE